MILAANFDTLLRTTLTWQGQNLVRVVEVSSWASSDRREFDIISPLLYVRISILKRKQKERKSLVKQLMEIKNN